MSLWLSGIGVSRGIAIGRAQKLHSDELEIPEYTLAAADVEGEVVRFYGAQRRAKEQLREVRARIPLGTPGDIAAFIDTHLLMMDDRSITDATVARIRSDRSNAEVALQKARDALIAVFNQMEDPYLRTRRDDVEHVCDRILRVLLKSERQLTLKSDAITEPTVILSDDITPADIILLAQQSVVAFVTEYGGPLSHTAILARSLGIPAVVGLHNARRLVREGEQLIVDGESGHVLADPEVLATAFYRRRQQQQVQHRKRLTQLRDMPAESVDGIRVHLHANIELPEDAAVASANGAEGVGLYRTEFLFMNRKGQPSEDEQYDAYSRVVSAVKGPITIRTLDLGADKQVDSGRSHGPTPNNPALGLRAIRLCLKDQEMFRTQVRALLRAAHHGQMKIMLPMISNLAEFRQAAAIIESCREELRQQGLVIASPPIGAMIEVPAAAIAASMIARHARFFSIGTNDLIQYTLAIDRVDDEVNYLYDPLHPAVLQLVRLTIQAGAAAGIDVSMCGEMAGDPRYTRLLLGLGLTEFSMHPTSLLEVKRVVRESSIGDLRSKVSQLLDRMITQAEGADELEALLSAGS
ncbi:MULTISPECIES: phosphoenolpyruvate--protein phosphotransferase [Hydrocarboniphaga]|jgi:phosphotransferase system enzyme I (PtsI)|uniref:Phosphoenolpyruvate-protein phosphotransferase n=2 Tax=Hydrocarboniphaga effusa TaxID=243629 RepID=I7ZBA5_9GAMM|nr:MULTISPECIES: phosphoenolpyruvate--protein phosphotransferase [Hydrocarboniphaga]EIT69154.1 phosphoenolpyruvate-protein phosphotransferase [Hydrocarboniphaga effusa AP103]MDZ4081016.1 phosphoenolpyruvate--protein phosphotransferase [Hydrocarboniphaga sp.]